MSVRVYTAAELKGLVLEQVNAIKNLSDSFNITHANQAYDTAVRECGFEVPISGDADLGAKNEWLIRRMKRWFYAELAAQYATIFDSGDIRAGQIYRNFAQKTKDYDLDFKEAKENPATLNLFVRADQLFDLTSGHVFKPGFQQDMVGQEIAEVYEE